MDRLLSNTKFDMRSYFSYWVLEVIGNRKAVIISMDWTEFDKDAHSTIALYMVTSHGRGSSLIWKTDTKKSLENNMSRYEKEILEYLKEILSKEVKVTILADRGFGNISFYNILEELDFDYVVRFKFIHISGAC